MSNLFIIWVKHSQTISNQKRISKPKRSPAPYRKKCRQLADPNQTRVHTWRFTWATELRSTRWGNLVGGWAYPSEKYESQLGLFPIYGKIKNVPNHQPGMFHVCDELRNGNGLSWSTSMVLDSVPMIGRSGNFHDLKTLEQLRHHGNFVLPVNKRAAMAIPSPEYLDCPPLNPSIRRFPEMGVSPNHPF